jgi:hypothetical protein
VPSFATIAKSVGAPIAKLRIADSLGLKGVAPSVP